MRSPNHNSRELVRLRFQCGEIADAAFIGPASVIDYQNVARLGRFYHLQENVNAAEVFCGQEVTRETAS
jgi:hypothetical protein